jgi:hypothetical protein
MTDETTRSAGRRGIFRESHEPRLAIENLIHDDRKKDVTTAFLKFDHSGGRTSWGMDNNGPDPTNPPAFPDGMGDCGIAMIDHGGQVLSDFEQAIGAYFAAFGWSVPEAYWAYGIANGETGTPPAPANEPDQGVDNATLFAWLYKIGAIDWYAEIPIKSLDYYANLFEVAAIGQLLDDDAEADFEASPRVPWGSRPGDRPDPSEGHDTLVVAGDGEGGGVLVTWGGTQPFVLQYRNRNVTDAWVFGKRGDPNINWAAMDAALLAVHGTIRPAATPPAPVPAPAAPTGTSTAESLWEELKAEIEAVPDHIKGFLHGLHKVADAAMEHEAIDVIEELIADALRVYTHGLL